MTATGARETIVTSPIEAEPQYLMRLSGPGYAHVGAALFTAGFFLLLTVKAATPALICGVLAIVSILVWMWDSDPPSAGEIDIGGGIVLPTYASGPVSHSWWAAVVLLLVAAALYLSYLFGFLYLWTVAPERWPRQEELPPLANAWRPLMILALSGALLLDLAGHWRSGLRPQSSGYAAMIHANAVLQAQIVAAVVVIALFAIARLVAGRLDRSRRAVFEVMTLLWLYALGQAAFGLLLTHGFPRLVAQP